MSEMMIGNLITLRVAGSLCTTEAALKWFFERITAEDDALKAARWVVAEAG